MHVINDIGIRDGGILNRLGLMKENGLKIPAFEESSGSFRITFERSQISGGLNAVYEAINKNEGIQAKVLSERLSMPLRTIERYIKKLGNEGKIVRKGSKKTGGYWKVLHQK